MKTMLKSIVNSIKSKKLTKIMYMLVLFILICFYYEWITNITHHVEMFFGVEDDSFLGIIAILFWGVICVLSGFFLGFKTLKSLSETNNLYYKNIEEHLLSIFNNKVGKLILVLFVVFFLFFSSSSKYYNNYYGLSLKYDDEEFIDMGEYYDYVEREFSFEAAESLSYYNNDLLSKNETKSRDLELIEHLFSKEEFILKETGAFQGYSTYSLKKGFLPYLKCLFFSFLETAYRAILFFIIIGVPLLLLVTKCSDEQLRKIMEYGASILFIGILLWLIYYLGKELFEWIKSFIN